MREGVSAMKAAQRIALGLLGALLAAGLLLAACAAPDGQARGDDARRTAPRQAGRA